MALHISRYQFPITVDRCWFNVKACFILLSTPTPLTPITVAIFFRSTYYLPRKVNKETIKLSLNFISSKVDDGAQAQPLNFFSPFPLVHFLYVSMPTVALLGLECPRELLIFHHGPVLWRIHFLCFCKNGKKCYVPIHNKCFVAYYCRAFYVS